MVIKCNNFNLRQIAESGQCFRMNKISKDEYSLIAYGEYLRLKQIDNESIELDCDEKQYNEIWKDYFDMEYDYQSVIDAINDSNDRFLMEAVKYGHGIRILKQDVFEVLISFIISQRKSIPAIKSSIEQICISFGERKESKGTVYYTFPTPEKLADADFDTLRGCGVGYRDEYIVRAAKAVLDGDIQLEELKNRPNRYAIEKLKGLYGVGEKVANCVALFGLHHIDSFPIDVWIERVIDDIYDGYFETEQFNGYAGIVQQYMFYYGRNNM